MEQFSIDIAAAYQQAFGLKRPIFAPITNSPRRISDDFEVPEQQRQTDSINFQNITPLSFDDSPVKSSLGTVVLSPITFLSSSYKERQSDGRVVVVEFEELILPYTSTVEVTFQKTIVKTALRGGRGEFKELIGTKDAKVKIRGILVGEDLKRPEQQIRKLQELKQVPKEIAVVCDYLNWLDITYLVIEGLSFPDMKGKPNMRPFELICSSDKPIELILNAK